MFALCRHLRELLFWLCMCSDQHRRRKTRLPYKSNWLSKSYRDLHLKINQTHAFKLTCLSCDLFDCSSFITWVDYPANTTTYSRSDTLPWLVIKTHVGAFCYRHENRCKTTLKFTFAPNNFSTKCCYKRKCTDQRMKVSLLWLAERLTMHWQVTIVGTWTAHVNQFTPNLHTQQKRH